MKASFLHGSNVVDFSSICLSSALKLNSKIKIIFKLYLFLQVNDKKLPKEVREAITEESKAHHKYASFNRLVGVINEEGWDVYFMLNKNKYFNLFSSRNEPCALPAICEMIAAFSERKPEDVSY